MADQVNFGCPYTAGKISCGPGCLLYRTNPDTGRGICIQFGEVIQDYAVQAARNTALFKKGGKHGSR